MRSILLAGLLLSICAEAYGQQVARWPAAHPDGALDSDHDGLSDADEQVLLEQFAPQFMISRDDCSTQPAEFVPMLPRPVVAGENDTIYGQAFPHAGRAREIELHYYDLWKKDCGQAPHDLDAEHVSVLLRREDPGTWKARYWYAGAHEDTLCDASQVARAAALGAELQGPQVWISSGKHAAFLGQQVCGHGCGADACVHDERAAIRKVINLGEPSAPMNGATWATSAQWPLAQKMQRSDFSDARLGRLQNLPADEIVWANPGKRPAQAAISGGDAALNGAATGVRATGSALTAADSSSSQAMDIASKKTGNALVKSYRGVRNVLRKATRSKPKTRGHE